MDHFDAGSFASFTLTYTAGRHGIDDSGGLRIVFRFATDQSRPQFEDPRAPGYTTAEASNNAVLECRYDPKGNVRPWDRTVQIKVVRGFLQKGDTVTVRFGDPRQASPGMRLQTFCEDSFEFRVLVDPVATYQFQPLPEQPAIAIVPGSVHAWRAVVPTVIAVGDRFRLCLKAEDVWGNPTDKADTTLLLRSAPVLKNLPERVRIERGQFAQEVVGLAADQPGDYRIEVLDENGTVLCQANAMRVLASPPPLLPFWGDLHGQSEETIGTNSAAAYFAFGRDRAFVDVIGHQGNDFEITPEFWEELQRLTARFDAPGRYVTCPSTSPSTSLAAIERTGQVSWPLRLAPRQM